LKPLAIVVLALVNLGATVLSQIGLKWAANSQNWHGFITGQVVGNLAGFVGVIALTLLLRFVPMHLAMAISMGFGFVLVQVVAAHWVFHEALQIEQWLGVGLVAIGIIVISYGSRNHPM
jgi:multidrug transporter EmrE-like cation transporter